tara:strand:+ start:1465 stop:2349 length:885 start_codon:yes stop_codon:yes gene_type:complete
MTDYSVKLNTIANNTDLYLKNFFLKKNDKPSLIKPMKYGVFSGGKRFRSAIVVNTGKIFKTNYKKLIIIGSAVECLHSYSLMHDDLPAMDDDDVRRGKPSTHKKFNEYTAILAGNSLLTLAFKILSSKELKTSEKIKNELINALSNCSGYNGLAGGQYSDLTFENNKISKAKIINMQKKKTGELFGYCCESVAILNGLGIKKRKFFRDIGLNIGLLFQTVDDLIDYKGDSKTAGKQTKKDKKRGKATLVSLLGYKKTLNFANDLKTKIDNKIKKFGIKSKDLIESTEFILNRKF